MAQLSHEDQCKDAIRRQDHDKVLTLLPSLKHHNVIKCAMSMFFLSPWLLGDLLPRKTHLLHICALLGWITIVQLLVTAYSCSPLQDDEIGLIALHYAALGGHLDIVQYFIQECNINPMSRSKEGIVPLLFAAYSGEKILRDIVVCTKMKLKTVQYLVEQYHCDPMVRKSNGCTPLHYAACGGDVAMVQYLMNNCHCDPMARDDELYRRTPVHYALEYGHWLVVACLKNDCGCHPNKYNYKPLHNAVRSNNLPLCQHLIDNEHHDPLCIDGNGNTPLHIACKRCHVPIIQYLLSFPTVDPLARDVFQDTPLMVAADFGHLDEIAPIFEKFGKVRMSHSVGSFVNIFLLGDPKAGKTTLTQVIKDRASSWFNFGTVDQVKSSTVGIVPTRLNNTEIGNVILHDFAGQPQYYSSHTAVLENLLSSSGAVFLLLINLTQNVLKQIYFWWSVVLNECSKVSSQCHLIVIGSHVDQVSDSQSRLALLGDFVSEQVTASNINVGGVFTLNCCQRSGSSLEVVLTELSTMCKAIRSKQSKQISLFNNFLYELFDNNTSKQNVYTLPEIKALCKQARQRDIPLPEDVTPLLTVLHSSGLIVYLQRDSTDSWVIVNKEILLSEVDGILFAPEEFSEHCDIASNTGIITTTALATLFPHYSLDMLISFLKFMKLCEQLDPSLLDATNLQIAQDSTISNESILFFPALIAQKRPQKIEEHFRIGWCLKCEPKQFFSVRFLHILLLQLAYRYALPHSIATSLVAGLRRCSVWINGIYWNDTDGIKTLVEQVENNQCVILLMSCQSDAEQDMMQLHCELVEKIVALQQQYCPILHCTQYLIEPSQLHYPFDQPSKLPRYYIKEVVSCIEEGKRAVVQQDGTHSIAIDDLLPIEAQKYLSLLASDSESQDIDLIQDHTHTSKSTKKQCQEKSDELLDLSDPIDCLESGDKDGLNSTFIEQSQDTQDIEVVPNTLRFAKKQQHQKDNLDLSDLNDVVELVKVIVDWKELGLKLGLHYDTLEEIDEEQRGRIRRCRREMLAAWLHGEDDAKEQTWSTLVDAVEKMDTALSEKIKQMRNLH